MTTAERVIIAGGGGFGREVLSWALDCHEAGRLPEVAGFLDDKADSLIGFHLPRIGSIADYVPQPQDRIIVAIGKPATKRKVVEALQAKGAQFATLLHPSAVIARTANVEEGVILCPFTMVNPNARAGRFVTIISFSGLGHDAQAGEYSTISSHVDITGGAVLGSQVFVGSGARILPGVSVGDGAVVGAGSVVMRRVKAGATVFTQPARVLR